MSPPVFKQKLLPSFICLMLGAAAFHNASAADEAPQAAAATTATAQASKNAELETVEIRGLRATLQRNLSEKRGHNAIVDSIRLENVGKFPDRNVADSLQRVPGISVDRNWGEGKAIIIRGTDKSSNMTQLNGQAVSSSEWWLNEPPTRSFNCDILPSEIVGSLNVYKSPLGVNRQARKMRRDGQDLFRRASSKLSPHSCNHQLFFYPHRIRRDDRLGFRVEGHGANR